MSSIAAPIGGYIQPHACTYWVEKSSLAAPVGGYIYSPPACSYLWIHLTSCLLLLVDTSNLLPAPIGCLTLESWCRAAAVVRWTSMSLDERYPTRGATAPALPNRARFDSSSQQLLIAWDSQQTQLQTFSQRTQFNDSWSLWIWTKNQCQHIFTYKYEIWTIPRTVSIKKQMKCTGMTEH